ncbi:MULTISPECIES: hypothetical protein [unclassified Nocardiopsis]|uniref:hypothetical protein n=1 Tax=Nocardiopsis TaxID=2013 RepID=UPI00387B0680
MSETTHTPYPRRDLQVSTDSDGHILVSAATPDGPHGITTPADAWEVSAEDAATAGRDLVAAAARAGGKVARLAGRRIRAYPLRSGFVEISVDPVDGDGLTTPPDVAWEVPTEEIAAVIRVLSGVIDQDALDVATTIAELKHEVHVATWKLRETEKAREADVAAAYQRGIEDMRSATLRLVESISYAGRTTNEKAAFEAPSD